VVLYKYVYLQNLCYDSHFTFQATACNSVCSGEKNVLTFALISLFDDTESDWDIPVILSLMKFV
jgi:hypothetical protein